MLRICGQVVFDMHPCHGTQTSGQGRDDVAAREVEGAEPALCGSGQTDGVLGGAEGGMSARHSDTDAETGSALAGQVEWPEARLLRARPFSIGTVVECLQRDQVVALPTDTLYGEAVRASLTLLTQQTSAWCPLHEAAHMTWNVLTSCGAAQQAATSGV